MKWRYVLAVSLLAMGGLAWWLLDGERMKTPQPAEVSSAGSATALQKSESAGDNPALGIESAAVTKLRLRVKDLTLSLQSVVAERENIEGELQQAEREVARLERFVEEIEERGEDPVDFADEGLAMFQPAFYAYQEAFDKLELAENMEQTTTQELEAAKRELALILQGQAKAKSNPGPD